MPVRRSIVLDDRTIRETLAWLEAGPDKAELGDRAARDWAPALRELLKAREEAARHNRETINVLAALLGRLSDQEKVQLRDDLRKQLGLEVVFGNVIGEDTR